MTAREITDILCRGRWQPRQHVLVPNVSWGLLPWEADLAVMYGSGWLEEVEIKVSRADYRREFNAKPEKHMCLQIGLALGKPLPIRKYWIAMPQELAAALLPQVPCYAGVIGVDRYSRTLRDAPVLKPTRKLDPREQQQLLRLAYLRYWDLRRKER